MDTDRFDHLTRVVATRRRGLAALIGAVALVISSPAADAKRKTTRCEFETCRGVCCKHHQECTVLGCTSRHNTCEQGNGPRRQSEDTDKAKDAKSGNGQPDRRKQGADKP